MQCTGDAVNSSRSAPWSVPKRPQRLPPRVTPGLPGWGVQAAELAGVSLGAGPRPHENVGPLRKARGKVLFKVLKQSLLLL